MQIYDSNHIQKSYSNVIQANVDYAAANSPAKAMQTLQDLTFRDSCEQQIHRLLVSHAIKAEAISPGGYESFIDSLTKRSIEPRSNVFNEEALEKLLTTFCIDDAEMLLACFEIAGLKGKIILSPHPVNGDSDFVEVNTGCFFPELIPAFELKATKFLNPKIICIDGFIESVAEVHRILEDAAASKETILLLVRGLTEEVTRTLKVNYDRGSLQVIPIIVKYDLDDVNTLVDVAITSQSDVISSLKGELITNIDITKYRRVDSVDITATGVLVENDEASTAIDNHIKKLQEKILRSENQYEKDSITKRVQNLGMNRITIRLKEDKNKKERSLRIDRSLRAIKSSMSHGVCAWKNGAIYPYAGIKSGHFFANKFTDLIKDLGALVA